MILDYRELAKKALQAREHAYVPYSQFAVGAALLTQEGNCYWGCNIENAAYTPSNCAERTAFFEAVKLGEREFKAIAVAGGKQAESLPLAVCSPCGVCLQVMLEFCNPETFEVVLVQDEDLFSVHRLKELIPFGFTQKNL
ncbi:cytidine deaminase [Massilimaliae timonensis]|uniref:Cytidine deaminase n=1 Tax=Massiliimalia timonensis TaxID=1987501 RepID=A0A8J6TY28_9FIRM|nr:cytidine deaminase [Massiliimalia timonensis]MBC8609582.1 cytidine deaminase [Massiliimalia timonensis]